MKKFVVGLGLVLGAVGCSGTPDEEAPAVQAEQNVEISVESCEHLSDHEAALCQITQIADLASNITTIGGALGSAQQILQLIGAIPSPPDVGEILRRMEAHLSRLGVTLGIVVGSLNRNLHVPDGISAAEQTRQLATLGVPVQMSSETFRVSRRVMLTAVEDLSYQRIYGGEGHDSPFWTPAPFASPASAPAMV